MGHRRGQKPPRDYLRCVQQLRQRTDRRRSAFVKGTSRLIHVRFSHKGVQDSGRGSAQDRNLSTPSGARKSEASRSEQEANGRGQTTLEVVDVNKTWRFLVNRSNDHRYAVSPAPAPRPCRRFSKRAPFNQRFLKHLPTRTACRAVTAYLDKQSRIDMHVYRNRN